ncbi:ICEBs1 excisionase [Acetobacterium wieringae]|uniref:ICEBs1 excisionase n=1 Tax=Acetobacterium wieringae TaxID=52694 RepID=UPI002B4BA0DC|nr:ICEBs1 excisionase [Acetobacterium wieringae]
MRILKSFITAPEVAEAMGVSVGKGYAIIRELNKELKSQGYIVIAGKVSRKFFSEKYYGYSDEGAASDRELPEHTGRP